MLGALLVGNFTGAYLGTKWGERLVRDLDAEATEERLAETEAAVAMAEAILRELSQEIEHHHNTEGC